jgi:hypothetical protein
MFSVTVSACLKFICARFKRFGNSLILFTEFQINKLYPSRKPMIQFKGKFCNILSKFVSHMTHNSVK